MSSTDLVISPIAIPPALREAGVQVVETNGVRTVVIPPAMQQTHNVVQPVSEMTQADPDWSPRLVVVDLSADQYSYSESSAQALTKNGILLLAHAAGIDVDVEMMPRAQLRESEVGYKATAVMRRSDGTLARWTASKVDDLDLEKSVVGKRHLPAKTESKAILRAVSLALQLKRGGYSKQDLQKPFLIVGVSSTPSDPEVRRARALQAGGDLYGKRALELAPAVESGLESSQYEDSTPTQQIAAPPADVVDIKPSATPAEDFADEPDPVAAPVAGEIPAGVAAAGDIVVTFGKAAQVPRADGTKGVKVCELSPEHLRWLAIEYQPTTPDREAIVTAARVYHGFMASQR